MGTGYFSVVLLAEINYGENSYYYYCLAVAGSESLIVMGIFLVFDVNYYYSVVA